MSIAKFKLTKGSDVLVDWSFHLWHPKEPSNAGIMISHRQLEGQCDVPTGWNAIELCAEGTEGDKEITFTVTDPSGHEYTATTKTVAGSMNLSWAHKSVFFESR